jgi:D-beta-D-heptose 7-phosphate kinase / D-beta-D-heptose 1-phosphate adenosyltransferase
MVNQIPDFTKAKVLIVGDVMLDRYWHGPASRISPEAPVPVVKVAKIEDKPGGAGNVALNIAALEGQVTLMGLIGEDNVGTELKNCLQAAEVDCRFQTITDRPTVTKLRVLSQHQQLIRLDFEEHFEPLHAKQLLLDFTDIVAKYDVVILSDYGKGTLKNIKAFIDIAKEADVPVFIDPKSNNFADYQGATLITPNFKEFQAVVGECPDEQMIVAKAHELLKLNNIDALLITRGERGMTLIQDGNPEVHLPTRAREIFDVTGAGDTVIAVMALCVAAGLDFAPAMKLANAAAGIVVGKLGSATASLPELLRAVQQIPSGGIMNEEQLLLAIKLAKAHGEKIVMTNGCFDILHAGHIAYLEQAKKLGNRLIIAVNDDASVAKLKGKGRPINNLEKRMVVLSALGMVDWVVPFAEDTPARLICNLLPNILVKGGDYKPEEIAGADCVIKNGGKVKVLDYIEGCSSTDIIDKAAIEH